MQQVNESFPQEVLNRPFKYAVSSPSTPEAYNFSAVAFRRTTLRQDLEIHHSFALFYCILACATACFALAVERLCNRGGAAQLTEKHNFNLKVTAVVGHFQQVTNAYLRAAWAGWPLERILPSSQALEANARVLKNRAAQSHLSKRTEVTDLFATSVAMAVNFLLSAENLAPFPEKSKA